MLLTRLMLTMVRPRVISLSMAFTSAGSVNSSCPDTRLWQHTTSKHACLISSHHSLSCSRDRYRLLAKFLRTIAKKAGGANKQNTHLWGNFTFVSHSSHKSSISQLHCNFEESCVDGRRSSYLETTSQIRQGVCELSQDRQLMVYLCATMYLWCRTLAERQEVHGVTFGLSWFNDIKQVFVWLFCIVFILVNGLEFTDNSMTIQRRPLFSDRYHRTTITYLFIFCFFFSFYTWVGRCKAQTKLKNFSLFFFFFVEDS